MPRAGAQPQRLQALRGKRGDRSDDILEVARRLFVERGWESTTMADIAAECGIAEGTIYLYFGSKRELINGVAVHWSEQLLDNTARQLEAVEHTVDKIAVIIQNHLTFMLRYPDSYFLFFREIRTSTEYAKSRLHEVNRRYTDLLKGCLVEALRNRPAPALPVGVMRDMVYGGVEHVGWAYIVRGEADKADIPRLVRSLASSYMLAFGLTESVSDLEARLARIERALDVRLAAEASPPK
jgi:AcrR family transcriptional regulator